jgi:hypothetical protein
MVNSNILRYDAVYQYQCSDIQNVPGGKVNILGGPSIGHSKQKLYMNMCPIPNGFQDTATG